MRLRNRATRPQNSCRKNYKARSDARQNSRSTPLGNLRWYLVRNRTLHCMRQSNPLQLQTFLRRAQRGAIPSGTRKPQANVMPILVSICSLAISLSALSTTPAIHEEHAASLLLHRRQIKEAFSMSYGISKLGVEATFTVHNAGTTPAEITRVTLASHFRRNGSRRATPDGSKSDRDEAIRSGPTRAFAMKGIGERILQNTPKVISYGTYWQSMIVDAEAQKYRRDAAPAFIWKVLSNTRTFWATNMTEHWCWVDIGGYTGARVKEAGNCLAPTSNSYQS